MAKSRLRKKILKKERKIGREEGLQSNYSLFISSHLFLLFLIYYGCISSLHELISFSRVLM